LGSLLQESWCQACPHPREVTHDPMLPAVDPAPDSLSVTVCTTSFSNRASTSGSDSRFPKTLVQISNRRQYSSPAAQGRPSNWIRSLSATRSAADTQCSGSMSFKTTIPSRSKVSTILSKSVFSHTIGNNCGVLTFQVFPLFILSRYAYRAMFSSLKKLFGCWLAKSCCQTPRNKVCRLGGIVAITS